MHARICPQCCGEQREVTLDCPAECPYLQQARQHETPRRIEDVPADSCFAAIDIADHFLQEHEPLLLGVWHTLAKLSRSDRELNDRELIAALANSAKSYQTLVGSGLVYERPCPGPTQQTIMDALRQLLAEFREVERQHRGYTALKDSDVLKAVVFTLRLAHMQTSGRPRSRRFLDFLRERFPDAQTAIIGPDEPGGHIIVP